MPTAACVLCSPARLAPDVPFALRRPSEQPTPIHSLLLLSETFLVPAQVRAASRSLFPPFQGGLEICPALCRSPSVCCLGQQIDCPLAILKGACVFCLLLSGATSCQHATLLRRKDRCIGHTVCPQGSARFKTWVTEHPNFYQAGLAPSLPRCRLHGQWQPWQAAYKMQFK